MAKRRIAGTMLVAVLVLMVAGCDLAKVGARCKVGAPLARDRTHVLNCVKGRWARFITIQQATDFIIGTLPGTSTVTNATPIVATVGGAAFTLEVKVTRRNGNIAGAGTPVQISGPGIAESVTATTDAAGVARAVLTTNGTLGAYDLLVKVNGAQDVTVPSRNVPSFALAGGLETPVLVGLSRGVVFRLTDAKGTPLVGLPVTFSQFGRRLVDPSTTNADGRATAAIVGDGKSGEKITLTASAAGGSFDVQVETRTGFPATATLIGNSGQVTIGRNSSATLPSIRWTDAADNPVPATQTTYSITFGAGSINIANPFQTTDSDGVTSGVVYTSGNNPGTYQIRATSDAAGSSAGVFINVTVV